MLQPNIRAAVVGLGQWGQCHVETLCDLPQVQVVALCDANAARAAELATTYGVSAHCSSPQELWQRDDIDLVVVATPEHTHLESVLGALRSGKHVLVEKAVATRAADAREMAAAAAAAGRFVVPGHILRFDVRYAQIKEYLQRGAIGQVVSIFSRRTRPQNQFVHHGANHTAFVTMPHDIDLALWWAGSRVTSVRAHQRFVSKPRRVVQSDAPDLVWATLQFENGIIAVLQASWLSPAAAHVEMADNAEVIGETGLLQAQTADSGFSWWSDEPLSAGRHSPDLGIHHRLAGHTGGALRAQLAYLTSCIRSAKTPDYTSFEDAIHGVEIAEAIVRSALSGADELL